MTLHDFVKNARLLCTRSARCTVAHRVVMYLIDSVHLLSDYSFSITDHGMYCSDFY